MTGHTVEVFWADLTLWQAGKYASDLQSWWEQTKLPIRRTFAMSESDYWDTLVSDHAAMCKMLGLYPAPPPPPAEPDGVPPPEPAPVPAEPSPVAPSDADLVEVDV